MRRSYNSGSWAKARKYAYQIIDKPKEKQLARSVIIRSYWNQQQYETVVITAQKWPDSNFHTYVVGAIDKLILLKQKGGNVQINLEGNTLQKYKTLQSTQPLPAKEFDWNTEHMVRNFAQEGNRIWFRYPEGYCYWDMPENYNLESTHSSLLELTAEVLLSPWHTQTKKPFTQPRTLGLNPSLAFSAGTDSTAAMCLMPENTTLGYHKRDFKSKLKHKNAERLIDFLRKSTRSKILTVNSNHEIIRTYHQKPLGFSTDMACASHLILLADHLELGGIGFGMPLDNTWLWKGRIFRSFEISDYWLYWRERFLSAGIEIILPIAGISEAGTMKICEQTELIEYLNSCLRSDEFNGCENCWKCLIKNGPLGRPYNIDSEEIQVFLNRRPLPTATHALWTINNLDLKPHVPKDLHPLLEIDFSWWAGIYPPAKKIIPRRWRKEIWDKAQNYLENMPTPYALEEINLFNE